MDRSQDGWHPRVRFEAYFGSEVHFKIDAGICGVVLDHNGLDGKGLERFGRLW